MPEPGEIKRGPKGGRKHTPGRGHDAKSGPRKRKRFAKRAAQKRAAERRNLIEQWERWELLSDDVKRMRPELKPTAPRPDDDEAKAP